MSSPPAPLRYRVVERRTVLDAGGRRAAGLDHWPDGTVGRLRRRGRLVSVGPNGNGLARTDRPVPRPWRRAGAGPLGVVTAGVVDGLREPADYVAGGPLHHDHDRDLTLLVYHAETHPDGDPRRFYSTLGLAVSTDGARTFADLGRVVRAELAPEHAARSGAPVEVGPGTLVVTDDRFVLLFRDFRADGRAVNVAAAGAPRRAVLDAAARGEGVPWHKFDGAAFAEPGLGGRPAELLPHHWGYAGMEWSSAARLDGRGCWAVVHSAVYFGVWSLVVTATTDGVHFSAPTVVEGSASRDEALYVSASVALCGAEHRELGPDGLEVLRVVSPTGGYGRWDDARLERLVLRPA